MGEEIKNEKLYFKINVFGKCNQMKGKKEKKKKINKRLIIIKNVNLEIIVNKVINVSTIINNK